MRIILPASPKEQLINQQTRHTSTPPHLPGLQVPARCVAVAVGRGTHGVSPGRRPCSRGCWPWGGGQGSTRTTQPHAPGEILRLSPLCLARSSSSQPPQLLKPNVPGWQSIARCRTQASHLSSACAGKDSWPILFFCTASLYVTLYCPPPRAPWELSLLQVQGCPDISAACPELCSGVHLSASLTSHADAEPCVEPFPPQQ